MTINKTTESQSSLQKMAKELFGARDLNVNVAAAGTGINKQAADVDFAQTMFYSPRLTPDTWYLPRTRKMLLKWVRIFFDWDPYVHCLVGDTKIALVNGTTKTLKELYDEKAEDIWVYSISPEGDVVPGQALRVELTRPNAEVLRITLDSGELFECTPDHRVMLRDGSYKEAQYLESGDSLMPLYRRLTDSINGKSAYSGYEEVYNPRTASYELTHRLFCKRDSNTEKDVIHHVDLDKRNNCPDNLKMMSWSDHVKVHTITKDMWKDATWRSNVLNSRKKAMTPQKRKEMSDRARSMWADPNHRKLIAGIFGSPEYVKKRSDIAKNFSKETRKKIGDSVHRNAASSHELRSSSAKYRFEDPKQGKQHGDAIRNLWKLGVYGNRSTEKLVAYNSTPEARKKNSDGVKRSKRLRAEATELDLRFRATVGILNHKVASVERLVDRKDTYDIVYAAPHYNFALDCGVFVHNSILTMHAKYPISNFSLVAESQSMEEFLDEAIHQDDWDIMDTLREASLSMQKYGEAIVMGSWNDEQGIWESMNCLDPALIEIQEVPFTGKFKVYAEIPSKYVALVRSNKQSDEEKKKLIPKEIVDAILNRRRYIELNTEERWEGGKYYPPNVCVLTNKTDVGEAGLRGLPPIISIIKTLVFGDHLRKAQLARAQRFAYPIEFWQLGSVGDNIIPNADDLKAVRDMLKESLAAPPFSIVYSPLLKLEIIGAAGSLLPIYEDLEFCENQILVGLGTNKNMVLGEGGWLNNAKTLSLQRLLMDYQCDRDMWTRKLLQHFLLRPICLANGYYDIDAKSGKKKARVPGISWDRSLDMQREEDQRGEYIKLWEKGLISSRTLFTKFPDLDFESEVRFLEKEKGTILDGGHRKLPTSFNSYNFEEGAGQLPSSPGLSESLPESLEESMPEAPGAPTAPNPPAAPEAPQAPKE